MSVGQLRKNINFDKSSFKTLMELVQHFSVQEDKFVGTSAVLRMILDRMAKDEQLKKQFMEGDL